MPIKAGFALTRGDRYLALGAARFSLGMLFGLLALFVLGQVVDKLQDLGQGQFNLPALLEYVLLSVPKMAYELIPLAVLLGVMAYLSLLAGHSELVALRMAGWSLPRLARPLWGVALAAGLMVFALGEWVVPYTGPAAESLYASKTNPGQHIRLVGDEGIWFKEGASLIRIGSVEGDGRILHDITILHSPSFAGLTGGLTAASGLYQGGRWLLHDVERTWIRADRLDIQRQGEMAWQSAVNPKTLRSFAQTPEFMSSRELWKVRHAVRGEGLNSNRLALVWWRRLSYPWVPMIMVAVVLPFVVGSHRGGGVAARLLLGLILGLAFHFMNQMSGYVSVAGGIAPWFSALLPLVIFTVLAWILMARTP